MKKRGVILLSGGIDSTVLAHYLKKRKRIDLKGLTFDYGQKHRKEVYYAHATAGRLGFDTITIGFDAFRGFLQNHPLLANDVEIPSDPAATVIPGRNTVFLSIATQYAWEHGINRVYFGAHATDGPVYPDCTPEYVRAMSKVASTLTDGKVRIKAPFIKMKKEEIVRLGRTLGVDLRNCWTCYEGGENPCGKCPACRVRYKATAG